MIGLIRNLGPILVLASLLLGRHNTESLSTMSSKPFYEYLICIADTVFSYDDPHISQAHTDTFNLGEIIIFCSDSTQYPSGWLEILNAGRPSYIHFDPASNFIYSGDYQQEWQWKSGLVYRWIMNTTTLENAGLYLAILRAAPDHVSDRMIKKVTQKLRVDSLLLQGDSLRRQGAFGAAVEKHQLAYGLDGHPQGFYFSTRKNISANYHGNQITQNVLRHLLKGTAITESKPFTGRIFHDYSSDSLEQRILIKKGMKVLKLSSDEPEYIGTIVKFDYVSNETGTDIFFQTEQVGSNSRRGGDLYVIADSLPSVHNYGIQVLDSSISMKRLKSIVVKHFEENRGRANRLIYLKQNQIDPELPSTEYESIVASRIQLKAWALPDQLPPSWAIEGRFGKNERSFVCFYFGDSINNYYEYSNLRRPFSVDHENYIFVGSVGSGKIFKLEKNGLELVFKENWRIL